MVRVLSEMSRNKATCVKLKVAATLFAFLILSDTAGAGSIGEFDDLVTTVEVFTVISGASSVIALGGNIKDIAKHERGSSEWMTFCWVTVGLNAATSVSWYVLYSGTSDEEDWLKIALINTAVLALDVGLTIWASSQPEKNQQLTVRPVVMQDIEGNPAVGVGLNLVNW